MLWEYNSIAILYIFIFINLSIDWLYRYIISSLIYFKEKLFIKLKVLA